jgi:hypothetical protein
VVDQVVVEGTEAAAGTEGVVVEQEQVEQVAQQEAPAADAQESDEDAEFAKRAAEADARIRARNGESPAPKAADVVVEPAPVAAKEGEQAPAKVDPPTVKDEELLAAVPESQRPALAARLKAAADLEAENKRLAHDNRSQAGRVAAFQRKYEEAAGKRPAEVVAEASAADQAEWTQFASDYPDIAKAIEGRFKAARPDADPTIKELTAYVESEKRERYLTGAFDAVEAVHPGWRDQCKTEEFKTWLGSSPTYGKLAASDEITDAIALLDLYDGHVTKSKPQPKPVDQKAAAEAAKLAARRGAQVDGAKTPRGSNAQPNPGVDLNDGDQLFAFFAEKSNARIKARYQS